MHKSNPATWLAAFFILAIGTASCSSGAPPATNHVVTSTPTIKPSATVTFIPSPAPTTQQMLVVFDDDGSPDGTTALLYLLAHPQAYVKSVTISYGESHPEVYIQHVGRMLDKFGIHDIALGAGQPTLLPGGHPFPEWVIEAGDGFWGFPISNAEKTYPSQDAAELMVATISQSPEPVTVFISGPCTNFARALRLDPNIRNKIAAVFIMGGAIHVPGNIDDLLSDSGNTAAEWNIYGDPLATREILASGLDIYLVPLDATNQVLINQQDTRQWRSGGEVSDFAADIYDMLMSSWNAEDVEIWDLMAAAIMTDPSLCGFEPIHLEVVTEAGSNSGQTIPVPHETPNVNACLKPNVDSIKQTLVDVFSQN